MTGNVEAILSYGAGAVDGLAFIFPFANRLDG
jgi:hypothetical protein